MRTTIEMAREAAGDDWGLFQEYMPEIHRLAELVRADERARMAEQPAQQEPKFFTHCVDQPYDWSEWVCPDPKSYLFKCCDCGLVHEAEFGVVRYKSDTDREDCDMVDDPNLQAVFRMRRSEQWSPADMQMQQMVRTDNVTDAAPIRTPAEDLARIREILNPAISDLANTFGVSRQSVYNWLNGEQLTEENAAKLRDLALAADVLAHEGIAINSALLKRKFANGRTLMQVSQAGDSAMNAAVQFVQIHKREMAQRERMTARFANRTKSAPSADFDLPSPNDHDMAHRAGGLTMEQPAQQEPVAGCVCRWNSEGDRVVTCERHQGWLEVIAEWADRARDAEKKLKALNTSPPSQEEPVACRYGDNGYACCEGGPCAAEEHNDKTDWQERGMVAEAALAKLLDEKGEPVAVVSGYYGGQCVILPIDPARIFNSNTALYTTPPPCPTCEALARTVMLDQTSHDTHRKPLTPLEIENLRDEHLYSVQGVIQGHEAFTRAIEAKLKEKNT